MNNNYSDNRSTRSQTPIYMQNWSAPGMETNLPADRNPMSDTGHHDGIFMAAERAFDQLVPFNNINYNNNYIFHDYSTNELASQQNSFALVNQQGEMSISFRGPSLSLLLEDANNDLIAEDWDMAFATFQEADSFYPNNAVIQAGMGLALEGSEKWAEAIHFFDRAIELAGEDMDLQHVLAGKGACLLILHRFEEALPVLLAAHAIAPNNYDVIVGLGTCYMYNGNWIEAKNAFLTAYAMNPHVTKCHELLTFCYDKIAEMNLPNND